MYQFKCKNTTVELHFLFVCVVTLFFLLDQRGTAVIALSVALMHELGHIIALGWLGCPPRRLSFHLFGIKLEQSVHLLPAWQEGAILLAGSAVNLLTFALLYFTMPPSAGRDLFAGMHLLIGIINLLPVRGLDGGSLLELFLTNLFSFVVGHRLMSVVQCLFLLGITLFIGYYSLHVGVNTTMLLLCCYLWLSLLRS